MIQFNLLPDVKLEYIKAQRLKRSVIAISTLVVSACIVLLLLLAGAVYGLQRNHISNLTDDINDYEKQIQSIPDINRILTVQNQLNTINQLHDDKPVTTRLFAFLETVTPADVDINRVEISFGGQSIQIAGQATDLATVNKFVDTLKFTTYIELDDDGEPITLADSEEEVVRLAFSDVVLTGFSRNQTEATYRIELSFNPIIFASQSEIGLVVPDRITTRSEVDRPKALFQEPEDIIEEIN